MGHQALYVYYKVDATKANELRDLVRVLHEGIRQKYPQILIQWLQRVGDVGTQTWMEIYQHPQGVGTAMQQGIDAVAAGLSLESSGQVGPRHVEVFIPCV